MLPVRAAVLDAGVEADRAAELFAAKYAAYRPVSAALPEATTRHYSGFVVIRLDPAGPPVSWDNSRIRLRPGG